MFSSGMDTTALATRNFFQSCLEKCFYCSLSVTCCCVWFSKINSILDRFRLFTFYFNSQKLTYESSYYSRHRKSWELMNCFFRFRSFYLYPNSGHVGDNLRKWELPNWQIMSFFKQNCANVRTALSQQRDKKFGINHFSFYCLSSLCENNHKKMFNISCNGILFLCSVYCF